MNVIHCKNYDEMSVAAAKIFSDAIKAKPDIVLGLATGSTPEGMYAELVKEYKAGALDFSRVVSINLDEYCGLPGDHDQSYRYFMQKHLFNHVNIDPANTYLPVGDTADHAAEAARYEKFVASIGYADLQVLGVGGNGHIGFNEPDDAIVADTHVTDLKPETIKANSRFFASENDVPRQALTMGLGAIMNAKAIVLMASGAVKKEAMRALLCGDTVSTKCPVTLLKLHPNVTVICDDEAWPC